METLGKQSVPLSEIRYPSSQNPRLTGLNKEHPSIDAMVVSLKKTGGKPIYAPVIRKMDGWYDPVDGDRRLLALDKMGRTEVECDVRTMTDEEAFKFRLIANIDREDLTAYEQGHYCVDTVKMKMKERSQKFEEEWLNTAVRGEYYRELGDMLGYAASTIQSWILIYLETPELYREVVAKRKEEIRRGKVAPTHARLLIIVGRRLNDVEGVFEADQKYNLKFDELRVISKQISSGLVANVDQLVETCLDFRENWQRMEFSIEKDYTKELRKIARDAKRPLYEIARAAIIRGLVDKEGIRDLVKTKG